jgi:AraC-like DNA-binding protein
MELEPVRPSGQFAVQLNVVKVGRLTAGYLRLGEPVRIRTVETKNYHIDLPLCGQALVRSGLRDPVYSTPDTASVFLPGLPAHLDWGGLCAQVCLMLPGEVLQVEVERLLGHPVRRPLDFASALDLMSLPGRSLLRTLRFIDRESRNSGGLLDHPLTEQHLEQALLDSVLLAVPHNYSDALSQRGPRATRRSITRAIELLRSSPQRTWTVGSLAAEVSVSVRSVQEVFRSTIGVSPMKYLREVRLERAHHELASTEPGSVMVSEVAAHWGFTHLGRFAGEYRSRYLESPSQTLRSDPRRLFDTDETQARHRAMHVLPGLVPDIRPTEIADP